MLNIGVNRLRRHRPRSYPSSDRHRSGLPGRCLRRLLRRSANKVAAQYEGMKVYKTGEELIHAPEVQAVVITSSDPSHAGYVLEALKAGKFVFCEKPLAQNAGDCEKIIAAETAHAGVCFRSASCAAMTAAMRR